eukprot:TRINITY_DN123520_c0_g1_i1.p1 TRINITY_DN123520_c0_g1~~TRINITY_DN123520_c0_g1_i1.p1  ORF type:complete len:750 (-),score=142.07 TRINITY_DN123520_c0_g1_i1:70-2319(-)
MALPRLASEPALQPSRGLVQALPPSCGFARTSAARQTAERPPPSLDTGEEPPETGDAPRFARCDFSSEDGQIVTKDLARVGRKVKRHVRDWRWQNQDGGAGKEGTIVEVRGDGWVRVKWEANKETGKYRIGAESKWDLIFACEASLGLLIDWTMPLPVIASVDLDVTARTGHIEAGYVLTGINENGLCCGVGRSEVEFLLKQRPLCLVMEVPWPERRLQMNLAPWRRQWDRSCTQPPLRETQPTVVAGWADDFTPSVSQQDPIVQELPPPPDWAVSEGQKMARTHKDCFRSTGQSWMSQSSRGGSGFFSQASSPTLRRGSSDAGLLAGLHALGSVAEPRLDITSPMPPAMHRYTALALKPLGESNVLLPTKASHSVAQEITDLRMWHLNDMRFASLPKLTCPESTVPMKPRLNLSRAPTLSAELAGKCMDSRRSKEARPPRRLQCLGKEIPWPDACYEKHVWNPKPHGPGPAVRWPLDHGDSRWICRITDLVMATRIREAYEYGFRGRKLERETIIERCVKRGRKERFRILSLPGQELEREDEIIEAPSRKRWGRIDDVPCDICGLDLADPDNTGPFYFCLRCKKGGHRFEICSACHALEVLQSEGKWIDLTMHPHFTYCQHGELETFGSLAEAYPYSPHLYRACCDYCGQAIFVKGAGQDNIHVCRKCPEERGYRFELCTPCAQLLGEKGLPALQQAELQETRQRQKESLVADPNVEEVATPAYQRDKIFETSATAHESFSEWWPPKS